jgi:hypothetical protein
MSEPNPQDAIGLLRSVIAHRGYLTEAMGVLVAALQRRMAVHDLSKLRDDEFVGFSRINAAARIQKFGSPEYAEGMRREKPTIDQHFARNRHHAEYFTLFDAGGESMNVLDIIEMVCDWWAASKGYSDPRPWSETVALNLKTKGQHLSREQQWLVAEVAALLDREVSR